MTEHVPFDSEANRRYSQLGASFEWFEPPTIGGVNANELRRKRVLFRVSTTQRSGPLMSSLLTRIIVPVASIDDADSTCAALDPYLDDVESIRLVHVIEKAGGAIDKASVEQRRQDTAEMFELAQDRLDDAGFTDYETDIRFSTDIVDAVFESAAEFDATAVAFSPREANRWVRLLSGDVALDMITSSDRPVIVLPDVEDGGESGG